MSLNFIKRIITSIMLIFLFLIINFSNKYIFAFSICLVGLIICFEANRIFLKLLKIRLYKSNDTLKKYNFKFLLLNLVTFFYILLFFISNIFNSNAYFFSISNLHMFFYRYRRICVWEDYRRKEINNN